MFFEASFRTFFSYPVPGTTSTATKVSHGEFELVQQSKRFVPGSLVGIKDIDFVGRSEAETP